MSNKINFIKEIQEQINRLTSEILTSQQKMLETKVLYIPTKTISKEELIKSYGLPIKKCTCGCEIVYGPISPHSTWCEKYQA